MAATPEQTGQMSQLMQQMSAQIASLQCDLAGERSRNDNMGQLANAIENLAKRGDQRPQLVDTKGLGKPSSFGTGTEQALLRTFPVWQRKMANFITAVYPGAREVLDWAATHERELTDKMLDRAYGTRADDFDQLADLNHIAQQIYVVLVQYTEEEEANDIASNAVGRGFEAWRKLARRYDPLTGGRMRNLLRSIINPGRAKLEELQGALEKWEELIAKYTRSKDLRGNLRVLPEDIKMAVLESLVPAGLEEYLQLTAAKFDDYDSMKAEIVSYAEAKTGKRIAVQKIQRDKNKGGPMDVDSLGKAGKGGGKSG